MQNTRPRPCRRPLIKNLLMKNPHALMKNPRLLMKKPRYRMLLFPSLHDANPTHGLGNNVNSVKRRKRPQQ